MARRNQDETYDEAMKWSGIVIVVLLVLFLVMMYTGILY